MNVERAISVRRSIRKFNTKPITDEVLRKILLAGNDAPSALNNQKKAFVAVMGESAKGKLNEIVKKHSDQATIERISARCNGDFNFFYYAPAIILVASCSALYPEADCACAIENMYLRATDLGLGACWINQLTRVDYPEIKEFLKKVGLSEDYVVYGALAVGYTDEPFTTKEKSNRIIVVR
jgi:nitroreductase